MKIDMKLWSAMIFILILLAICWIAGARIRAIEIKQHQMDSTFNKRFDKLDSAQGASHNKINGIFEQYYPTAPDTFWTVTYAPIDTSDRDHYGN